MSKEQLEDFIKVMASSLEEDKRIDFINNLIKAKDDGKNLDVEDTLIREVEDIKQKLNDINNSEDGLEAELDYDSLDNYYGDEEIIFFDPNNILETIKNAIDIVHKCVDKELYSLAYSLAYQVLKININVEGDNVDIYELDYEELIEQDIIRFNRAEFCLDTLLATYFSYDLNSRSKYLYETFILTNVDKLEALLLYSQGAINDLDLFLTNWLCYLLSLENVKKNLLLEAIDLQNDKITAIDMAIKYGRKHPYIYKHLLDKDVYTIDEKINIGMEAINNIDVFLQIRSEIALLTAHQASLLGKNDIKEKCWLEAFRSNKSVENFFRLKCEDVSNFIKEETNKIYLNEYKNNNGNRLSKDKLSNMFYYQFFNGEFSDIINNKSDGNYYIPNFIASFILLLSQKETFDFTEEEMSSIIARSIFFKSQNYNPDCHLDDSLYFHQLFLKWKKDIKISDENSLIQILDEMIVKYVTNCLKDQNRASYPSCATYIYSIADIKVSRGLATSIKDELLKYKNKYPKHRSFHKALNSLV